jgi:hypothetical protein
VRAAIEVTPEDLADLKRRLRATRWPETWPLDAGDISLPTRSPNSLRKTFAPSCRRCADRDALPLDLLLIGRIGGHRSQR